MIDHGAWITRLWGSECLNRMSDGREEGDAFLFVLVSRVVGGMGCCGKGGIGVLEHLHY